VRLLGENGKQESRARTSDKQLDPALASFIDSISDPNVKASIEEKLNELDAKNNTIHVCSIIACAFYRFVKHYRCRFST